jgi:mono/diheme cytochrome c family protein
MPLSIAVTAPGVLTVTTASLPAATINTAYSQTLAVSGGTAPYTWSVSVGALPVGLNLNAATGAITGTPTAVATTSFTVRVTDSATPAGAATKPLSITVNTVVVTIDGAALYAANCASCHGALTSPSRQHVGATVAQINTGIANNSGGMGRFGSAGANPLSQAQIAAISLAMQ